MKTIIPPPPPGPPPERYSSLLPDHRHLPAGGNDPGAPFPAGPIPDHTLLPDKDGTFVRNSYEPTQSHFLTETLRPALGSLHPAGDIFIGEDCGIYWRLTDPPERGVKAPDWYIVCGVPALLNGQMRRSYVLWQETVLPTVILEYVSGDGGEERDTTPFEGKFWVYERIVRPAFYGIYDVNRQRLDVFHQYEDRLQAIEPQPNGRFPIKQLGVELGVWQGSYEGYDVPWLRWWDSEGNLLLTGREEADSLKEKLRNQGMA